MGDVMKESASIAWSWVKHYVTEKEIVAKDWYESRLVHLHIPEGATPKDGPSAGITMATALLSLIQDRPINVITSYSIHYTKLYESFRDTARRYWFVSS